MKYTATFACSNTRECIQCDFVFRVPATAESTRLALDSTLARTAAMERCAHLVIFYAFGCTSSNLSIYVFIYRKEVGIFYFMQKVIAGCLNFSSNRMATLTVKVNKE